MKFVDRPDPEFTQECLQGNPTSMLNMFEPRKGPGKGPDLIRDLDPGKPAVCSRMLDLRMNSKLDLYTIQITVLAFPAN
jgi:hypothetical protein